MAFKDIIKPYFLTGKKPTQVQFFSFFDKIRWADEEIAMDDVTGLLDALNAIASNRPEEKEFAEDGSFDMLAKYKLESISARNNSSTDITLTFSWITIGPVTVPFEILVPAHGTADLDFGKTFWAATTITVTGINGGDYDVDNPITLLIFRK